MELGSRRPTLTKPCYRYPGDDGYRTAESGYGDECGLLSCRPRVLQRFASIKVTGAALSGGTGRTSDGVRPCVSRPNAVLTLSYDT